MHILQFLFLMMFNFLRQLFVPKCPTMEKELLDFPHRRAARGWGRNKNTIWAAGVPGPVIPEFAHTTFRGPVPVAVPCPTAPTPDRVLFVASLAAREAPAAGEGPWAESLGRAASGCPVLPSATVLPAGLCFCCIAEAPARADMGGVPKGNEEAAHPHLSCGPC